MYCKLDRSKPCPFPLPPTATYLGEDANGYYHMDGFFDGLGNMFKRMVKFTPKSFTPANLYKGFINTTLTTATFGAYQVLPKNVRKTMYNVGKIAVPVIAAGVGAAVVGPSVMSALGPKLASAGNLIGKGLSSVGGSLFGMLSKLPSNKQAEVAEQVTDKDIAYAEQHGGQYPPHIQALIEQAERQSYEAAALQAQMQAQQSPLNQQPSPSLYASSSLYPGLQTQQPQQPQTPQEESSAVGPVIGGAALLLLLLKR